MKKVIVFFIAAAILLSAGCNRRNQDTNWNEASPAAATEYNVATDPASTGAGETNAPSADSATPSSVPADTPEASPSPAPTEDPTAAPTETPTEIPTAVPTEIPTAAPTDPPSTPTETWEPTPVKYDEMVYARPSLSDCLAEIGRLEADVKANEKSRQELLDELTDFMNTCIVEWNSMYSLANVKFCIDTTVKFWTDEVAFYDDNNPTVERKFDDLLVACAASPHKKYFEDNLFGKSTLDEYVNGPLITDEIAELMRQEAELVTKFQAYDYMTVEFRFGNWTGDIVTLLGILYDRGLYSQIESLYTAFYNKINQDAGSIFVDLLKIRKKIAAAAGYDSYEQYVYDRVLYRDYSPEDAMRLANGIRDQIFPLYESLVDTDNKELQAMFAALESFPALSYGDMSDYARSTLSGMDGSLSEAFEFMEDYDLCYLGYGSEQAGMSFTTYIPKYVAPFIVIEGSGDVSDLLTFVHEFGHFYDNCFNYGSNNNLDMSEISSTALSYIFDLYLSRSGSVPKTVRDAYHYYMEYSILETFLSQAMYHIFESRLYTIPDEIIDLQILNSMAQSVATEFGMDPAEFGMTWPLITHYYVQPFYVISYVTSNAAALQLYDKEVEDRGAGLAQYMGLVKSWDLESGFVGNLRRVGLKSPFTDQGVSDLVASVRKIFK
jgi:hypothetical protein